MFKKLTLFTGTILFSNLGWGGLFFEPFVGYETATGQYEVLPSSSQLPRQIKSQGPYGGIRLGAKVASFWIAIEPTYSQGTITSNYTSTALSSSDLYSSTRVSGLMGFDFAKWLRFWAGVGVYDLQKETYSAAEASINSNSYQVGVGLTKNRWCLNLGYISQTPVKIKDTVAGNIVLSTEYSKAQMSRWNLSLGRIF